MSIVTCRHEKGIAHTRFNRLVRAPWQRPTCGIGRPPHATLTCVGTLFGPPCFHPDGFEASSDAVLLSSSSEGEAVEEPEDDEDEAETSSSGVLGDAGLKDSAPASRA